MAAFEIGDAVKDAAQPSAGLPRGALAARKLDQLSAFSSRRFGGGALTQGGLRTVLCMGHRAKPRAAHRAAGSCYWSESPEGWWAYPDPRSAWPHRWRQGKAANCKPGPLRRRNPPATRRESSSRLRWRGVRPVVESRTRNLTTDGRSLAFCHVSDQDPSPDE